MYSKDAPCAFVQHALDAASQQCPIISEVRSDTPLHSYAVARALPLLSTCFHRMCMHSSAEI